MAPATSPPIVPSLPPSVEEAYRRKCVQLKQRMAEVEETNDAARIRLARLKRQVEKQRLERAFLLEQLAKRTSTNVEDSDGSPSPPPTPKEKPLRIKRGHRKASIATGAEAGASFGSHNAEPLSPGSDAAGHSKGDSQTTATQASTTGRGGNRGGRKAKEKDETGGSSKAKSNSGGGGDKDAAAADAKPAKGTAASTEAEDSSVSKRPGNGFELYCAEMRPTLADKQKPAKSKKSEDDTDDGDVDMGDAEAEAEADGDTKANIDAELARGWTEMEQSEKDKFEARAAAEQARHKKAKEEIRQQKQTDKADSRAKEDTEDAQDAEAEGAEEAEEEAEGAEEAEEAEDAEDEEEEVVVGGGSSDAKGKDAADSGSPSKAATASPDKDMEDIEMVDTDPNGDKE